MKKQKVNDNEILEPLLASGETKQEAKGMGSEKWHILLRIIGPYLAGQGNIRGFLTRGESFRIKTLTKETLGEDNLKDWRGLHSESKQHCYTTQYLIAPWKLTIDPCHCFPDNPGGYAGFWMPCCLALCPLTLITSFLGCLVGTGKDCYNFSKIGIMDPLDDNKGIELGLFFKQPAPRIQVMQDEPLSYQNALQ